MKNAYVAVLRRGAQRVLIVQKRGFFSLVSGHFERFSRCFRGFRNFVFERFFPIFGLFLVLFGVFAPRFPVFRPAGETTYQNGFLLRGKSFFEKGKKLM